MAGTTSKENGKKGGRPKGSKSQATLEREAVLEAFRQKAMQSADVIFHSQLTLARGYSYLYKIKKKKVIGPRGGVSYVAQKPELVTAQWEIEAYLLGLVEEGDLDDEYDPAATYYYIVTKDPNNQAADSLLDRTFGKASQSIALTGENGGPVKVDITSQLAKVYGPTDEVS